MEKELFDYVAKRVDVLAESQASTQVTKDAALGLEGRRACRQQQCCR